MTVEEIIRAWKDARYRQSLSEDKLALLPENPAGAVELDAEELKQVNGAADPEAAIFFGSTTPACPTSHGILWWSER